MENIDFNKNTNEKFLLNSKRVIREPILFINSEKGLIGRLLFKPVKIECIEVFKENIGFELIKDYEIDHIENLDFGAEIIISNKNIPFIEKEDIIRPHGSENSYGTTIDGKKSLLFSENGLFHKIQTLVTYTHEQQWFGYVPIPNSQYLTKIKSILHKQQITNKIDIFVLGDSISAGGNCSKLMNLPPYIGDYSELLFESIRKRYPQYEVNLQNKAVGGMNSSWGAQNVKKIMNSLDKFNFDLNIIGFGVNDASGKIKPSKFQKNIRKIINTILKYNKNAEFILISSCLPNPLWIHTHNEFIYNYRNEYVKMAKDFEHKIEIADLSQLWGDILKTKGFYDLTGNGINHPNDFGHKLYYQVISTLLEL